jgi:hypothetical protein
MCSSFFFFEKQRKETYCVLAAHHRKRKVSILAFIGICIRFKWEKKLGEGERYT